MHWAVRISFERGFIDYIKRGNEQRLTMLGDALSEQYALHGNWKFLRNNDRFIFQLLKSFDRDNDDRFPGGRKTNAGGMPDGRLDLGPLTPMAPAGWPSAKRSTRPRPGYAPARLAHAFLGC